MPPIVIPSAVEPKAPPSLDPCSRIETCLPLASFPFGILISVEFFVYSATVPAFWFLVNL